MQYKLQAGHNNVSDNPQIYQKLSHADETNAGLPDINESSTIKTDTALTAVKIKVYKQKKTKINGKYSIW